MRETLICCPGSASILHRQGDESMWLDINPSVPDKGIDVCGRQRPLGKMTGNNKPWNYICLWPDRT